MNEIIKGKLEIGKNQMELVEFIIYKKNNEDEEIPCYYGINVFKVCEVIEPPKLVPLPNEIPFIEGMFNLRNEHIPLLNFAKRLNGSKRKYRENVVIVAEFNNIHIGLLVHKVKTIQRVSWDDIKPAPKITSNTDSELIIGVIDKKDGDSLIILDFESIVDEINKSSSGYTEKNISFSDDYIQQRKKKTIMIVDDSKVIRNQTEDFLLSMGYNVITKNNGLEAFESLQKIKEKVENNNLNITDEIFLLLTDIEMPLMDGYTLIKKIKEDNVLKKIPAVIQSSLSGENIKVKGKEVGADEYITKFNKEHIKEVLDSVIRKYDV